MGPSSSSVSCSSLRLVVLSAVTSFSEEFFGLALGVFWHCKSTSLVTNSGFFICTKQVSWLMIISLMIRFLHQATVSTVLVATLPIVSLLVISDVDWLTGLIIHFENLFDRHQACSPECKSYCDYQQSWCPSYVKFVLKFLSKARFWVVSLASLHD